MRIDRPVRIQRSVATIAASSALAVAPCVAAAQLGPPPEPAGNPVSVAKADLGKALFRDEQLSSTRTVSCGTCRMPEAGGGDPRAFSPGSVHPGPDGAFGTADDVRGSMGVIRGESDGAYTPDPLFGLHVQVTGRKTPTATNAGFSPTLFWDGRADDRLVDPLSGQVVIPSGAALENQALGPLVSGPGGGYGSIVLTAPTDPAVIGTSLLVQWLVIDSGGPGSFAVSPAAQLIWFWPPPRRDRWQRRRCGRRA